MTRGPEPRSLLGRRCPLRPVAGPSPSAELVRAPGLDPQTGAGGARCLAAARPASRRWASGLGGAGPAAALSLPSKEEAVVPAEQRREGALTPARQRWGRVLARRGPGSEPLPWPGQGRSPAAAPAPRPADAWKCLT